MEPVAGMMLVGCKLGMVLHSVAEPVVAVAEVYILVAGTVDTFDLPSGQPEVELLYRTAVELQADEQQMKKRQYCLVFLIFHQSVQLEDQKPGLQSGQMMTIHSC